MLFNSVQVKLYYFELSKKMGKYFLKNVLSTANGFLFIFIMKNTVYGLMKMLLYLCDYH